MIVYGENKKNISWDSADLNRGPSVPNARGWTKLPYYPKGISFQRLFSLI